MRLVGREGGWRSQPGAGSTVGTPAIVLLESIAASGAGALRLSPSGALASPTAGAAPCEIAGGGEVLLDVGIHVAGGRALATGQLPDGDRVVLDVVSLVAERLGDLLDREVDLAGELGQSELFGVRDRRLGGSAFPVV